MTTPTPTPEAVEAAMKWSTGGPLPYHKSKAIIEAFHEPRPPGRSLSWFAGRILAAEVERLRQLTALAPDTGDDSLYNVRRLRVELAEQTAEVERLGAREHELLCALESNGWEPNTP
jgi:hypothetical protein